MPLHNLPLQRKIMLKKTVLALTLLTLTACLLSFKFRSSPVALAKNPAQEEASALASALPAPPAEWVVNDIGGGTTAASVTRAGVAGTQHVADCVAFSMEQGSNTSNFNIGVQLLDGSAVL